MRDQLLPITPELIIALRDRASADISNRLIKAVGRSAALEPLDGVQLIVETLVGTLELHRGIITAMVREIPLGTHSNVLPDIEVQLGNISRIILSQQHPELSDDEVEEIVYIGMDLALTAALRIAIDRPPQMDRSRIINRVSRLLAVGLELA